MLSGMRLREILLFISLFLDVLAKGGPGKSGGGGQDDDGDEQEGGNCDDVRDE